MRNIARPRGLRVLLGLGCLFAAVTVTAADAGATTLPTVTLTASSTGVTIAGTLESGATNIVASAPGEKEVEVILFKLDPGVTIAEFEAYAKEKQATKDPNTSSRYGSIVVDTEAPAEVQAVLTPGQYAVITDKGEAPIEYRNTFAVAESKAPAALATPAATERSIDFAFRGPATLKDGQLVAFENEGFLVHMDIAFPVKSMKAAKAVVAALHSGKEKGLAKYIAGAPVAFAGPLSHGAIQEETITAKPGIYVQACFMATQDGRLHTLLGMERILKIAK